MKRLLIAAVVMTVGPLFVTNVASAAPAGSAGCVEPVPQRSYETDRLVYGIAADYTNCDWWDGGQIVLDAALSRLDGQGEAGAHAFALCGAHAIAEAPDADGATADATEAAAAPAATDGEEFTWSRTCAVDVDLDHPTVDTALYRGEVTYPWEGGKRTVTFAAVCGPTAGCVDLPADPSPALGMASDLYETLVPEGDAN